MKLGNQSVYTGVHDGYLYVEAFPGEDSRLLKLPLEKLYAEEIEYILGFRDWDTRDLEGYTHQQALGEFIQPEMPKILAWWTHFLMKERK